MTDDDILAMAKDHGDAKNTKGTIQKVTGKSGKKEPGPPAGQQPTKGPKPKGK
jgi:hypothetical protein